MDIPLKIFHITCLLASLRLLKHSQSAGYILFIFNIRVFWACYFRRWYAFKWQINYDQQSSTACGFKTGHLNSRPSKISEKVSRWAIFFGVALCYHSILNPRSAQAFHAQVQHPAWCHRLPNTLFPKLSPLAYSSLSPPWWCSAEMSHGCLSEWSTRELWAAWIPTELMKCHLSLAGAARPPGVRDS
jgi:hypothetical protein